MLGAVSNSNLDGMVAVLPWVPHTTSAVALRLMELDCSLCYTQQQKAESLKDEESADFTMFKTNYAQVKRATRVISAEAREYEKLEPDYSVKVGSGHANSGQGRNRVRGGAHCRVHGGKSQRKVNASRSDSAQRSSTKNSDRLGHLPAWKGQDRGKGRRKRGRRSVRNRQKPVKNVEEVSPEEVPITSQQDWNDVEDEETPQFEAPDNDSDSGTSGSEDYKGQTTVNDYEDLMVADYGSFSGRNDHASTSVSYNISQRYTETAEDGIGDYEDDHDEEDEEDGLANKNVQRYFDGESDDEGDRFMDEDLVETPNKDSESSSEYSD